LILPVGIGECLLVTGRLAAAAAAAAAAGGLMASVSY